MFEKTKEKLNNYFEEHPVAKKMIVTTAKVSAVAGAVFIGYKIGEAVERGKKDFPYKVDLQPLLDTAEKASETVHENVETVKDLILADNDHTFDVTFTDVTDGTKFIAKDYCLGSYVNDCLDGMDMDYIVEKATEEVADVAETVAEAVTE